MNKLIISSVVGMSLVAAFMLSPTLIVVDTGQAKHDAISTSQSSATTTDLSKTTKETQSPESHSHDQAGHNDEAGFDFTPYISQEMADEIRPYTSRSTKGLEVKVDKDGHEYVDLKKRWSHATVSVVDENGKKHTGEWAPK